MSHVIILPYYCSDEVRRYLRLALYLKRLGPQAVAYRFLLAASPATEPSEALREALEAIAPTISIQCPTRVFGYPQGPTAMFWDCMDYVARHWADQPGFSLWLESDMVPVKPDWIARLHREWFSGDTPLVMGCLVPRVYKTRWWRRRKLLLESHVNGGACYAKDVALRLPPAARQGVFDMAIYPHAMRAKGVRPTSQICFSTVARARRDVLDERKTLLHGYMQDKDAFLRRCTYPPTDREKRWRMLAGLADWCESIRRRARVWIVRRGPQSMFENMMLAKERMEADRKAA